MHLAPRREGKATFLAPDLSRYGDPTAAPVFYNPRMERSRTISVLVLRRYAEEVGGGLTVCEPLTGTGVRGIRYALETGAVGRLVLNDASRAAAELARRNAEANGVAAEVHNEDANVLLHRLRGRCDVVDIDPFGSPAPFMQAGFRALRDGGLMCLTATDVAVLVGRYPHKCLRRYGVLVRRTPFHIEVGLRALLSHTARTAAAEDFGVEPLVAYWEGHHYRACVRAVKGAREAQRSLEELGYVAHRGGHRAAGRRPLDGSSGPLWLGPLGDPAFIASLASGDLAGWLEGLAREYALDVPWHYRLHEFAVDGASLSLGKVLEVLKSSGVPAAATHMASDGFRSEASYGELRLLLAP